MRQLLSVAGSLLLIASLSLAGIPERKDFTQECATAIQSIDLTFIQGSTPDCYWHYLQNGTAKNLTGASTVLFYYIPYDKSWIVTCTGSVYSATGGTVRVFFLSSQFNTNSLNGDFDYLLTVSDADTQTLATTYGTLSLKENISLVGAGALPASSNWVEWAGYTGFKHTATHGPLLAGSNVTFRAGSNGQYYIDYDSSISTNGHDLLGLNNTWGGNNNFTGGLQGHGTNIEVGAAAGATAVQPTETTYTDTIAKASSALQSESLWISKSNQVMLGIIQAWQALTNAASANANANTKMTKPVGAWTMFYANGATTEQEFAIGPVGSTIISTGIHSPPTMGLLTTFATGVYAHAVLTGYGTTNYFTIDSGTNLTQISPSNALALMGGQASNATLMLIVTNVNQFMQQFQYPYSTNFNSGMVNGYTAQGIINQVIAGGEPLFVAASGSVLYATNNLFDVANPAVARTNLGLAAAVLYSHDPKNFGDTTLRVNDVQFGSLYDYFGNRMATSVGISNGIYTAYQALTNAASAQGGIGALSNAVQTAQGGIGALSNGVMPITGGDFSGSIGSSNYYLNNVQGAHIGCLTLTNGCDAQLIDHDGCVVMQWPVLKEGDGTYKIVLGTAVNGHPYYLSFDLKYGSNFNLRTGCDTNPISTNNLPAYLQAPAVATNAGGAGAGCFVQSNKTWVVMPVSTGGGGGSQEWTNNGSYLHPTGNQPVVIGALTTTAADVKFEVAGTARVVAVHIGNTNCGGIMLSVNTNEANPSTNGGGFALIVSQDDNIRLDGVQYDGYPRTSFGYTNVGWYNLGIFNGNFDNMDLGGYENVGIGFHNFNLARIGVNCVGIGHANFDSVLYGTCSLSIGNFNFDQANYSVNNDVAIGDHNFYCLLLGDRDVAIGDHNFYPLLYGYDNTTIGGYNFSSLTNGNRNVGFSTNVGAGLVMGDDNFFLGANSGIFGTDRVSRCFVVGAGAKATGDDQVVLGSNGAPVYLGGQLYVPTTASFTPYPIVSATNIVISPANGNCQKLVVTNATVNVDFAARTTNQMQTIIWSLTTGTNAVTFNTNGAGIVAYGTNLVGVGVIGDLNIRTQEETTITVYGGFNTLYWRLGSI